MFIVRVRNEITAPSGAKSSLLKELNYLIARISFYEHSVPEGLL